MSLCKRDKTSMSLGSLIGGGGDAAEATCSCVVLLLSARMNGKGAADGGVHLI
jgi:hypothetical protein